MEGNISTIANKIAVNFPPTLEQLEVQSALEQDCRQFRSSLMADLSGPDDNSSLRVIKLQLGLDNSDLETLLCNDVPKCPKLCEIDVSGNGMTSLSSISDRLTREITTQMRQNKLTVPSRL
jgi:hypothetical protein